MCCYGFRQLVVIQSAVVTAITWLAVEMTDNTSRMAWKASTLLSGGLARSK